MSLGLDPQPAAVQRVDVGSVIGAYRLLRRLGEGGMGEVFLAEHIQLQRQVALKLLLAERARDPRWMERFVREAWMSNRMRHEHLVDVTDLQYTSDGRPYVVMEYIDGSDLYALWNDVSGLEITRLLDVMVQAADALAAAHHASVVHRDLKPANIFLTKRNGRRDFVKIVDFGLGKLLSASGEEHFTGTGEVLATPPYMSPEQAMGEPLDGRSDVYSLGVIMWELLVGRRPFSGKTFGEYAYLHATRAIEPPSQAGVSMVPGGIPEDIDPIVLRCLAKRADDRYPSAAALRDALDAFRRRLERIPDARQARRRSARIRRAGMVLGAALAATAGIALVGIHRTPAQRTAEAPAALEPLIITARPPAPEPGTNQRALAGAPAAPLAVAGRPALGSSDAAAPKMLKLPGIGMTIQRQQPPARRRHAALDSRVLKNPFAPGEQP